MTFLTIALCLLAEYFLLEQEGYRQVAWFSGYLDRFQRSPLGDWLSQGAIGIVVLLTPPLLAVGLVQGLLEESLGGFPAFLFASAILLYCLGPKDLNRQVKAFIDARESGGRECAYTIALDLAGEEAPHTEPFYSRRVASGILEQANYRLFGVLFWFLLLGPLGAILYRLSRVLREITLDRTALGEEFHSGTQRLLEILDWLPARLTAATYAISGRFEEAMLGWRNAQNEIAEGSENSAGALLTGVGNGALGMEEAWTEETAIDAPPPLAEAALGLVWRSLLVWVGLLGLVTISQWVA